MRGLASHGLAVSLVRYFPAVRSDFPNPGIPL